MLTSSYEKSLSDQLNNMVDDISRRTTDLSVKILVGKYKGRQALLQGCIHTHKGFLFLCMVERADGSGPLNSDPESRSYRPESEFEVL